MRTLTRMRLLAAVCALLMTFTSIARADLGGRYIDRPGGPPDPQPVEVGDPDQPGNTIIITVVLSGRVFLFRVPLRSVGIRRSSVTRLGSHPKQGIPSHAR